MATYHCSRSIRTRMVYRMPRYSTGLVWIEIKRGAMLGGPNRKQHPSDGRDPASPGGLIASSLVGKRETGRKIRRARHRRARTLMIIDCPDLQFAICS